MMALELPAGSSGTARGMGGRTSAVAREGNVVAVPLVSERSANRGARKESIVNEIGLVGILLVAATFTLGVAIGAFLQRKYGKGG